jgi:hypothetical protein
MFRKVDEGGTMTPERLKEIKERSGAASVFERNIGFSGLGEDEAKELFDALDVALLRLGVAQNSLALAEQISAGCCDCLNRSAEWKSHKAGQVEKQKPEEGCDGDCNIPSCTEGRP